jgi:uncharacterized zinc-type alcohol dehydrogenase-like protein
MFKAYAASQPGGELSSFSFDPGALKDDEVQIRVEFCGICHSDLSMLNNDWGSTTYPFVPGHEVVGVVEEKGSLVADLCIGQRVGVGWFSRSCLTCESCLEGHQNLCSRSEGIIVGRHGGFSDRVRCHFSWATPVPEVIPPETAGPLFCGGITVFGPILDHVRPIDRVGVIGIGGLGHLAIKFLRSWGCEVTAFSSNPQKTDEILAMGAHRVIDSSNSAKLSEMRGYYNFILSTVNVALDWNAYINALAPNGKLHFVGAVLNPVSVGVFSLLAGNKSLGASPLGSIRQVRHLLDFVARHQLFPTVEVYKLSEVNLALTELKNGKARYRKVLDCRGID